LLRFLDLGSGIGKKSGSGIRDEHPGSATLFLGWDLKYFFQYSQTETPAQGPIMQAAMQAGVVSAPPSTTPLSPGPVTSSRVTRRRWGAGLLIIFLYKKAAKFNINEILMSPFPALQYAQI
jgi:hypothetical protein